MNMPEIVGVVNMTVDSFSDGGTFLKPDAAIEHAEQLLADGADILDLGAAASNPDAETVPPEEEIARLAPVVAHLKKRGARISIDSTKPEVQRWAIERNAEFLNDIRGFPDPSLYPALARSTAKLVVMHSMRDPHAGTAISEKALRQPKAPQEVLISIKDFFTQRLIDLRASGVANDRLIVDPGMGFFLASNPEPSFAVLASIPQLQKIFSAPLFIGVSRKSFLRNIGNAEGCDMRVRTVAAELYAALQGVSYIRTHDVRALHEGIRVLRAATAMVESAHYST